MDNPLITIGITCFNSEKYIIRALDSALNQDWQNKEVIIVDDFSSDKTIELIEEYIKNYDNFKLFKHKKNSGYGEALNSIIKKSNGEYIAIFDSDDRSDKERLKKQYKRYISYKEEKKTQNIICYSNRKVINNKFLKSTNFAYAIGRKEIEPNGKKVADFILGINFPDKNNNWGVFGSCTMFIKKSTIKKIGYFDKFFRREAEHDFAIRAAFKNFHFIAVDEPLVTQYKTKLEYKSKKKALKYSLSLIQKYKKYLISKKSYYGSICLTFTRNFFVRENKLLAYFFYFLALIFLPYDQKLLRIYNSKLIKKFLK